MNENIYEYVEYVAENVINVREPISPFEKEYFEEINIVATKILEKLNSEIEIETDEVNILGELANNYITIISKLDEVLTMPEQTSYYKFDDFDNCLSKYAQELKKIKNKLMMNENSTN